MKLLIHRKKLILFFVIFGALIFSFLIARNEVSAAQCCNPDGGSFCEGCPTGNPCGVGSCTHWNYCSTANDACPSGTAGDYYCYPPYPNGSCTDPGSGGGGTPPPGGSGGCTSGECFTGISNCGQVARPPGSGTCTGGICCGPLGGGQPLPFCRGISFSVNNVTIAVGQELSLNAIVDGTAWPPGSAQFGALIFAPSNPGVVQMAGGFWGPYSSPPNSYYTNTTTWPYMPYYGYNVCCGDAYGYITYNGPGHFSRIRGNSPGTTSITVYALKHNDADINNPGGWGSWNSCAGILTINVCDSSPPQPATIISPPSGSTVPSPNSATLQYQLNGWGSGCPSNINSYRVYVSTDGVNYVNYGATTQLTGLQPNTLYYWYVWKSNGSSTSVSAVSTFRTNAYPQIFYGGQVEADVCGTGTTGRVGQPNVTNPIKLAFGMVDADADAPNAVHVALIPRQVSGGAATYPNANVAPNINAWSSIYIAMSYGSGGNYWVSQYTPTSDWTGSSYGDFSVGNGRATVLGINTGDNQTVGVTAGQNTNANFRIRIENTFGLGVHNPTGIWDIYAIGVTTNSDGNPYPTYGTWDWRRMGQWKIDLVPPTATVSPPTYNPDGSFTISYSGGDNLPIFAARGYALTSYTNPVLRDNTIGSNITFGNPPSTYTSPPNAYNFNYGAGATSAVFNLSRNYTNLSDDPTVQYTFENRIIDQGCNVSAATVGATLPTPWILSSQSNVSVNGNVINSGANSSITIPDSGVVNVAKGKTVTTSGEYQVSYPFYAATKAVDGNPDGNAPNGSLAVVQQTANAWLQIDLGAVYPISDIKIFGRTDCCIAQSSDYYLFVSDVPFTSTSLAATLSQSGVSNYYTAGYQPISIKNVNRTGRYIRVQLAGNNYLSLGEVEVYSSQTLNITGLPGFTYTDGDNGPFFTTYSAMSGTGTNLAKPNSNVSKLNRFVLNYNNDGANPQEGNSWYDYLLSTVQRNTNNFTTFTTTNEITTTNTYVPTAQQFNGMTISSIFGITPNTKRNVIVNGNIWLKPPLATPGSPVTTCDTQSVIFIHGGLVIGPDIVTTGNNKCIFVVKGNIYIANGINQIPGVPLASSSQPRYDILDTVLISDGIIHAADNPIASSKGEGLYVRGSIVSNVFESKRDLNGNANALHPAVIIQNDPRYYQIFKDDLRVRNYSLRESR